jgi:predicted DNA binding CopG/RHH family protein
MQLEQLKRRLTLKMIKKSKSVTVRFTDDDYKYLKAVAKLAGQNVSGYIRMLANMSITAVKIKLQKGEIPVADFETLLND